MNEITKRIQILFYVKLGTKKAKDVFYQEFSRQTTNHWLEGDRFPSANNIVTICKNTGVSADWLLGLVPLTQADFENTEVTA